MSAGAVTARDRAEAAQRTASDPAVSAFVAASAGSGKTKLLTDRLLRLMLAGAAPERIQCLTFTKAAAAEMALRLNATLGRWVTLDDSALDARLAALDCAPSAAIREQARALFARVLDLPGGMRIGTIHAFCQSLLRRFPLEAQISPHFRLADDTDAAQSLRQSREAVLTHTDTSESLLALLAEHATLDQFGRLSADLQRREPDVRTAAALGADLLPALRRALGLGAADDDALIRAACDWHSDLLHGAAEIAARDASPASRERALNILEWLAQAAGERAARWDDWCGLFLIQAGTPRAAGAFVNQKLAAQNPELAGIFLAEAARIVAVLDQRRALRVAEASAALIRLIAPVLARHAERKENTGLLDFDDLIGRTARLLDEPGAAWVLYKLDGGLDHLLLDEVQDTAPAQWDIAHALTAEFFAGEGARDAPRTVFAVGDRKQSIFSFQGADAAAFDASRSAMASRVQGSGQDWRDVSLDVSFRSTVPVLALVDAVFSQPAAAAGVTGGALSHQADRTGMAGSVEIWPLAPRTVAEPAPPWAVPDRNQGFESAPQRLADALAAWIAGQTDGTVMLQSRDRPLGPGDVLVLLRRRGAFDRSLVRALKQRGVPVAGLDRLVLAEQPAVADLLALCAVLLNRDDDLSLACVLKSPLGFCDEDSLMALAMDRGGETLWSALRDRAGERPDWGQAHGFIAALMARVDHATPHALLSEALTGLGGRARLFARLGGEAAEPIDELLNQALAFQRAHPPSLQGFVDWLARSAREVKREAEGAGGSVRIMTVHGAKGLEAPLVILPDTSGLPPERDMLHWTDDPVTGAKLPLWSPRKEVRCAAVDDLRVGARADAMAEHNRLLYVALTRAKDRLLVCGWDLAKVSDQSWYRLIAGGFDALGATAMPFAAWEGEARTLACAQTAEAERDERRDHGPPEPLPDWAGSIPDWTPAPAPAESALPLHLAPSRPEGAAMGMVPGAASPLLARADAKFRRGRLIHTLLQHLPELPRSERAAAMAAWLARPDHAAISDGLGADGLAAEVLAVLDHPDLAPLFGPGSRAEVPLTGVIGDAVIGGLVDRLAVLPDRVLLADYKTNRDPPASIAGTPVLYLRQMAAYRALLRRIHPGREVICALVWTRAARMDVLPGALLDPHDPGMAVTAA